MYFDLNYVKKNCLEKWQRKYSKLGSGIWITITIVILFTVFSKCSNTTYITLIIRNKNEMTEVLRCLCISSYVLWHQNAFGLKRMWVSNQAQARQQTLCSRKGPPGSTAFPVCPEVFSRQDRKGGEHEERTKIPCFILLFHPTPQVATVRRNITLQNSRSSGKALVNSLPRHPYR